MIKPVEKLIQISPVPKHEQDAFNLDLADGRFQLADRIASDIEEWCSKAFDDGPRNHLGASIIGHECDRYIWMTFRWIKHKVFSGRMQRLFQDGHWYEERFIEMLRGIGWTVTQVNEEGGQQRIYAVEGHAGGSCDGTAEPPERYGDLVRKYGPFLLEFKTSNSKQFAKFHDVKESKPQHSAQMDTYGAKMGIRFGLYFIVNKDDSDIKIEVVALDHANGEKLLAKAEWIVRSNEAPIRLSNNPSDFRCKWCDYWKVCHQNDVADANCRSCQFAEAWPNKQWHCRQWSAIIPSNEAMQAGCSSWKSLQF